MTIENFFTEDLGDQVREIRNSQDLTLEDLAGMTGVSKTYLSEIETGNCNPSIGIINKVSRGLGISLIGFLAKLNAGQYKEDDFWREIDELPKASNKDKAKFRQALQVLKLKLCNESNSLKERRKFARIVILLAENLFDDI